MKKLKECPNNFFFAIFPDKLNLEKIKLFKDKIQKLQIFKNTTIKFVSNQKLHVTLHFLGKNISQIKVEKLLKINKKTIVINPFIIKFNSIQIGFSNKKRQILYLKPNKESIKQLVSLEHLICNNLQLKYQERSAFHLTIARIKNNPNINNQEIQNQIDQIQQILPISFFIKEIYFIRSDLNNFFPLAKWPLIGVK